MRVVVEIKKGEAVLHSYTGEVTDRSEIGDVAGLCIKNFVRINKGNLFDVVITIRQALPDE
jgi:hypothetical protein